jgi:hypothetical protein
VRVGGAVPEGGHRRGCDGGGDLLSMTRSSGRGETKVGAALDAVESGRGVGFWAALRKRKRFSDFDSRNNIQI